MKILLFNPLYRFPLKGGYEKYFVRSGSRWPHSGIKKKGELPHYLPFPFFLAYSAAWLKREGFEVVVADCVALDIGEEGFLEIFSKEAPDAVFFETTTPTIAMDMALVKKLKDLNPGVKVIAGGPHSSVYPAEMLKGNRGVDYVIRGEYEEGVVELLKCLRDNGDPARVAGITYRNAGELMETAPRPLIDPLDSLPAPAYDMFPASWRAEPDLYWDGFCQHRPAVQMHASRGCPYRCNFCLWNQVMYGNGKYRTFRSARVLAEMEELVKRYGVKEIYFDDDDFTINKAHVEELCRGLIEKKLDVKWSCMGDAINLTEELVALMAESGCVGIKFGVETGSSRMIKDLGKPVNLEKVKEVVRWCAAVKIKTHATFALGLLGEDERSAEETLLYLEDLGTDTIQVSIATPFPGTKFFEAAEREGLLKTKEWDKYDGKAGEVISHRYLDLDRVEAMRVTAMRRWLFKRLASPGWVARQAYYFFRVLRGLGPLFIFRQLRSLLREESVISGEK